MRRGRRRPVGVDIRWSEEGNWGGGGGHGEESETLKIWRLSDFWCIESIEAHDDAINGLVARSGSVYSSSADRRIKVWGKVRKNEGHLVKAILEGRKDVSLNSVAVSEDKRFVYGGCSDRFIMRWSGNNEGLNCWKVVCKVKGHKIAVADSCAVGRLIRRTKKVGGGLARHLVIRGHEGPVKCMRAGPSRVGGGFLLYCGIVDRSVRVWWVPGDSEKDLDLDLDLVR
ncbi:transducin/WD40 repeat-like superfamily protein, partial [Striga asiatica]